VWIITKLAVAKRVADDVVTAWRSGKMALAVVIGSALCPLTILTATSKADEIEAPNRREQRSEDQ